MVGLDEPRRVIWDPYEEPDGSGMEFRLTYEGPLFSSIEPPHQKAKSRRAHKHAIRKAFRPQLAELWRIHPWLIYLQEHDPQGRKIEQPILPRRTAAHMIAAQHARASGYMFLPLVREEAGLLCSLDVLYLRRKPPGGIVSAGDLDNRLKTLFDALSIPRDNAMPDEPPDADETPFHVLLADDRLVTHVSVRSDFLLQPTGTAADDNDARVIVTVNIRPYTMQTETVLTSNLGFT